MKEKQKNIETFSGIKIQLFMFLLSIGSALAYSYFNTIIIADQFIVFMLRALTIFADFGLFMAIGYLVDFKRGVAIGYIYKIIVFISLQQNHDLSPLDFVIKVAGMPFGIILYYKLILFIILITFSYIFEITQEQKQFKHKQQEQDKKLLLSSEKDIFTQNKGQKQNNNQKQGGQNQKTINRIKKSLKYHQQDDFYKKAEIFFFIIYHSCCLLILFPVQEYVIDFTKVIQLGDKIDFFKSMLNLTALNSQLVWYINVHTVINVTAFWGIILLGEVYIKKKYPQLIKDYVLQIPYKFILIQGVSLVVLCVMLLTTSISEQTEQLKAITLFSLTNLQIFGVAFLMHMLLPLLVSFLLIRLYLGQVFYLNRLVSKKYSFHKNQEDYQNLDSLFYEGIIQNDINKVRNCPLDQKQLIARHKLKRYVEEEKLKHYVDQRTVLQIQSLFEDFMTLDLYNKLSRLIAVVMFYISLGIFLVSMNINDTYIASEDKFFKHVPAIVLLLMLFFINKYESSINIFYPKFYISIYTRLVSFLAQHKAYNVIRLSHFYTAIFGIWIYRIYSQFFLPSHIIIEDSIRSRIYDFYQSPTLYKNDIVSSLLAGWSKYFTNRSQQCDYNSIYLTVDSVMLILLIAQILSMRHFLAISQGKWDTLLMILKVISPLYSFFVFVYNMECLQWSRSFFCVFLCIGITFMHNNQKQLERGIKRNQQGQIEER